MDSLVRTAITAFNRLGFYTSQKAYEQGSKRYLTVYSFWFLCSFVLFSNRPEISFRIQIYVYQFSLGLSHPKSGKVGFIFCCSFKNAKIK